MQYVFMDNFRGFSQTLVPLDRATFLVGENSTGKSSFLSLAYLLSTPQFWFNQDFSAGGAVNLGGFRDIVSFTSEVKNRFTVGMLATRNKGGRDKSARECAFGLLTFRNEEGMPRLSRYVQCIEGKLQKIVFLPKAIRFKSLRIDRPASSEEDIISLFLRIYQEDKNDRQGYKKIPNDLPPESPLGFVLAVVQSLEDTRMSKQLVLRQDIPITMMGMTWLAPIRTKPRRTYDGFKTNYTPEGDHTPHVLRKTLASREMAQTFTKLLRRFGQSSGLFSRVDAHAFGKDPAAPFEVRIEISGGPLNISSVGYGVSQVLPVIVEMLTRPDHQWFAIQQPEVHLHPRAQAALGDIMHFLVKEKHHNYILETHSQYLVDRFRFRIKKARGPNGCRVVFFERTKSGNVARTLPIGTEGTYPKDQPSGFRAFFIDEELRLLQI